jgi:ribonuclease-3
MRRTEQPSLTNLEAVLGHPFRQKHLLVQALTHSSLAYERSAEHAAVPGAELPSQPVPAPPSADNEQLEFLGDAVVGLLVAEFLFRRYPGMKEGELTRLRASLVNRSHLGRVGAELQLGEYMHLGRGEERSGGRSKSALLANCVEAVIGALYLDAGLEITRNFVERVVVSPYSDDLHDELERSNILGDHKSALQEYLQARKHGQPEYAVKAESGPAHRKRFLVEVRLSGDGVESPALARGIGRTKKMAEQQAARRALEKLQRRNGRKPRGNREDGEQQPALAVGGSLE